MPCHALVRPIRAAGGSPGSVRRLLAVLALLCCIRPTIVTAQFAWAGAAARVSGWQQDLDSVVAVFLPRDRSFDAEARARFVHDIHLLRDSVATLTDEQLTVRLATAVDAAVLPDAQTRH